jgi:hypothetical protein
MLALRQKENREKRGARHGNTPDKRARVVASGFAPGFSGPGFCRFFIRNYF